MSWHTHIHNEMPSCNQCKNYFKITFGEIVEVHSPTTAHEPFSSIHPCLDQVQITNSMSNKRHSKTNKFLPPFGILITIENTLIRLTRILWHQEAKTYANISYEDFQSQNVQFQGQISKSRRGQKTVRKTGFIGSQGQFSHFSSYRGPINLKFCRQVVNSYIYRFHVLSKS